MEYILAVGSTFFYLSIIYIIKEENMTLKFFKENSSLIKYFASIFIILLFLFTTIYFAILYAQNTDLGTLGGFFGGILNPLIASIGILLLYKTLKITQTTLKVTQEELNQVKTEFEKSQNILKDKNKEDEIYKLFELMLELEKDPENNSERIQTLQMILGERIKYFQQNNEKSGKLQVLAIVTFMSSVINKETA
jgi:peptidoglycan hydrolase CwlO-like protein